MFRPICSCPCRPKSKIVSLDLSGNSLSAVAAEAIAEAMPCLPALCDLNLSKNYIGDEGLLKLLGICGCVREACPLPASLQSLNLRDNNIGGRGAIKLAEVLKSGSMPAAAAIDLSHNWVDSPAAQAIARMQAAFPPSLRQFGLWKNMMCDDDATCRLFKDGKCKLEPPEHEHGMCVDDPHRRLAGRALPSTPLSTAFLVRPSALAGTRRPRRLSTCLGQS